MTIRHAARASGSHSRRRARKAGPPKAAAKHHPHKGHKGAHRRKKA